GRRLLPGAARSSGGARPFHSRRVMVGPRRGQARRPPVWTAVGSEGSAAEAAARDLRIGVLSTGWLRTPGVFAAYRKTALDAGREPRHDKLAYMALVAVGETREEGWRRADQILEYTRTSVLVAPQFTNPPGFMSAASNAELLKAAAGGSILATRLRTRDGRPINAPRVTVEEAINASLVFAGTPDDVFDQLTEFYDHVGGFGHLLMGQGGLIN